MAGAVQSEEVAGREVRGGAAASGRAGSGGWCWPRRRGSLGQGGIKAVAAAAGRIAVTVSQGVRELESGEAPLGRVRRAGRGPQAGDRDRPGAARGAGGAGGSDSRGDPESPLRWTTKSTPKLAAELTAAGHRVSAPDTVAKLLHEQGYSLQANAQDDRGRPAPGPGRPVRATSTTRPREHLAGGDPVISVDTKKKELVGRLQERRPGVAARPGEPEHGQGPRLRRPGAGQGQPRTASTTSPPTPAGSASAPTTTPPRSPSSTIRRWWQHDRRRHATRRATGC